MPPLICYIYLYTYESSNSRPNVVQKWSKCGPKVVQKWSKSGPKVVQTWSNNGPTSSNSRPNSYNSCPTVAKLVQTLSNCCPNSSKYSKHRPTHVQTSSTRCPNSFNPLSKRVQTLSNTRPTLVQHRPIIVQLLSKSLCKRTHTSVHRRPHSFSCCSHVAQTGQITQKNA